MKSDKRYRGDDLKTFKEKTARCMNCRSFLPVGVYAVSGRGVNKAHSYLRDNLSGIIRNAVIYERAQYSATRDQLTGLYNRRTLFKRSYELLKLSQRYKHPLCLCMFDIDHFKRFNDEHGHDVGDFVLKALSRFVSACMRTTDVFGRYGGEEFTILLPETKKEEALLTYLHLGRASDRDGKYTNMSSLMDDPANTGGDSLWFSPGIQVLPINNASVDLKMQLPIWERVNGIQLVTSYRLVMGVSYHF